MVTFLALPLFFFAQVISPEVQKMLSQQTSQQAAKEQTSQEEAVTSHLSTPSRSIMMITPKERAGDYARAYEMLRQEKASSKVFFTLANGEKVSSVIDMKLMPNSTVVVFRYTTAQGTKFRVVDIEDIVGIENE